MATHFWKEFELFNVKILVDLEIQDFTLLTKSDFFYWKNCICYTYDLLLCLKSIFLIIDNRFLIRSILFSLKKKIFLKIIDKFNNLSDLVCSIYIKDEIIPPKIKVT